MNPPSVIIRNMLTGTSKPRFFSDLKFLDKLTKAEQFHFHLGWADWCHMNR